MILFVATFFLSYGLSQLMRKINILDTPGERSSHTTLTPRSGGVGIFIAFLCTCSYLYFSHLLPFEHSVVYGYFFAILPLFLISLYDDIKGVRFDLKLLIQILSAGLVLYMGIRLKNLSLPFYGLVELPLFLSYFLSFFWIVGFTNAFNFMDGLNGLASGTALLSFLLLSLLLPVSYLFFCLSLASALLGFFVLNFPKGKLFLGDAGSQFLGFTIATFALVLSDLSDPLPGGFYYIPLLFFAFIYDVSFTLYRRWRLGEKLSQAHRSHLYQRIQQTGLSHAKVTSLYLFFCLLGGLGIIWLEKIPPSLHLLIFLPYLLLMSFYAHQVLKVSAK